MTFDESIPGILDIISWKLIFLILIMCIIRSWLKGAQFSERINAKNKLVLITGADVGIGKQVAREFNLRGAKVYMLCRNADKANKAIVELVLLGCNPERLIFKEMDLTKFTSIRKVVKELQLVESKVDILVNNAGVMLYPKFRLTDDGHETTWQTNYLGHFLLTELLLPLLKSAPCSRVVNVSALAHYYAEKVNLSEMDRREKWDSRQAYAQSKLAQTMHARELSNRLRHSKVTINSCHPGICYTRIMRHTPLAGVPIKYLVAPFAWFLLKTPKDGAQTILYLALGSKVAAMSGKYFSDCKENPLAELATDDQACQTLYNHSLKVCGLGEWDTVNDDRQE